MELRGLSCLLCREASAARAYDAAYETADHRRAESDPPGVFVVVAVVVAVVMPWGVMLRRMVSRGMSRRASSASARGGEGGSAEHQAGESHGHECFEFLVHSAPSLSVSV